MKVSVFILTIVAMACAEPPSNIYLPGSQGPSGQYGPPSPSTNYGAPSFGQVGRPGIQYGAPRPGVQYGAPKPDSQYGAPRPSTQYGAPGGIGGGAGLAGGYQGAGGYDAKSEPANYQFKYDVQDAYSGNDFGHEEERHGDDTRGKYYVLLPDGRRQTVEYTADNEGYKPKVSYEQLSRGGQQAGGYQAGGYQAGGYQAGGYQGAAGGNQAGGYQGGAAAQQGGAGGYQY